MKPIYGIALILMIVGGLCFFLKDPPAPPKATAAENYIQCTKTSKIPDMCFEIFSYELAKKRERNSYELSKRGEKNKQAKFLAKEYNKFMKLCLEWKKGKSKPNQFDGKSSCGLSAQIHFKDLKR